MQLINRSEPVNVVQALLGHASCARQGATTGSSSHPPRAATAEDRPGSGVEVRFGASGTGAAI
jgi:hypothetical protein